MTKEEDNTVKGDSRHIPLIFCTIVLVITVMPIYDYFLITHFQNRILSLIPIFNNFFFILVFPFLGNIMIFITGTILIILSFIKMTRKTQYKKKRLSYYFIPAILGLIICSSTIIIPLTTDLYSAEFTKRLDYEIDNSYQIRTQEFPLGNYTNYSLGNFTFELETDYLAVLEHYEEFDADLLYVILLSVLINDTYYIYEFFRGSVIESCYRIIDFPGIININIPRDRNGTNYFILISSESPKLNIPGNYSQTLDIRCNMSTYGNVLRNSSILFIEDGDKNIQTLVQRLNGLNSFTIWFQGWFIRPIFFTSVFVVTNALLIALVKPRERKDV
ncbi:MAG: hypothetical protein ACTSW1_01130 [Candidatus Hodarchaeales archaeon]